MLTEWLDHGPDAAGQAMGTAPTADENRSQVDNRIRPALGDIPLSLTSRPGHLDVHYRAWSD